MGTNGGAAGVLLVRRADQADQAPTHVVLHQRSDGTWAVPGGVIDAGETPREAAFRETVEEASLPRNCRSGADPLVVVTHEVVTYDHGTWKYTVIIGDVKRDWSPKRSPNDLETLAVRWVPVGEVAGLKLQSDFRTQWPGLLSIIQAANPSSSLESTPDDQSDEDPLAKDLPKRGPSLKSRKSTKRPLQDPPSGNQSDQDSSERGRSKRRKSLERKGNLAKRPQQDPPGPSRPGQSPNADLLEHRYQMNLEVRMNISRFKEKARLERLSQ